MAADKVLQTPELLEHIMSYLPPFEILATTIRVCWYWKQTIDSSPVIQEKLWMRSRAASTVSPYGFEPGGQTWPLGPLSSADLLGAKPLCHGLILPNTLVFRQSGTPNVIPRITFRCTSPSQLGEYHITCKMGRPLTHIEEGPMRKRPASRKNTSWRKMFLTDPLATTAGLFIRVGVLLDPKDPSHLQPRDFLGASIRDLSGIRLGLVRELAAHMMRNSPCEVRNFEGDKKHVAYAYVTLAVDEPKSGCMVTMGDLRICMSLFRRSSRIPSR